MKNLHLGHDRLGLEIANALGIKRCKSIEIKIACNEITTVKAEFYPEIDGVKQLVPIFKEYELKRR